jgi:hypothetical protein
VLRRGALMAVAGVVLALALPVAAPAQGVGSSSNPFSPGLPGGSTGPTTSTAPPAQVITNTNTSTSTGGGLSGGAAVAIALGAVVLLAGISYFIWRDARRRAPVRSGAVAAGGGRPGSKAKPKARKLSPAERRRRKRGRAR